MIVWRVFAAVDSAADTERGGPLWFPRSLQGAGRHDNPELYGCIYVSEDPRSAIGEALAPFRGSGALKASMLRRGGQALWLTGMELASSTVIDLDNPRVLTRERLRPSEVATPDRTSTQALAARLYQGQTEPAALRWWSTLEAGWINLTVFDRAARALAVREKRQLSTDDPSVEEAALLLGLAWA